MTHVTCRLSAKNWDQLRNSTLGNRLWATGKRAVKRVCVCVLLQWLSYGTLFNKQKMLGNRLWATFLGLLTYISYGHHGQTVQGTLTICAKFHHEIGN